MQGTASSEEVRRMYNKSNNNRILLIAQMHRVIELLENENAMKLTVDGEYGYQTSNPILPELSNKFREIRRDSVRYMNEIGYGK